MTEVIVLNRTNCALGLCSSLFLFCLLAAAVPLRPQTIAPPPQPTPPAPQPPAASTQPAAAPQVATPTAPQQPGTQPAAPTAQQPPAQQPGAPSLPNQDQPTETIRVQVNEVNLIFTVTDK